MIMLIMSYLHDYLLYVYFIKEMGQVERMYRIFVSKGFFSFSLRFNRFSTSGNYRKVWVQCLDTS